MNFVLKTSAVRDVLCYNDSEMNNVSKVQSRNGTIKTSRKDRGIKIEIKVTSVKGVIVYELE